MRSFLDRVLPELVFLFEEVPLMGDGVGPDEVPDNVKVGVVGSNCP